MFEANAAIIRDLKDKGVVVRHETYVHSYPHCWRTDTPLIYKAVSSWFVQVTAIKDRMLELNQQITWVPEHVRDGSFGKWLEGARDWSISRNRFWGSPIPVWKSDDPAYPRIDVYGSLDELERDFGVRPDDLHRPPIDELVRPNPDDPTGKSTMRRIPDVLDCWFESGSMPFAQVHYPFENAEWFESHFPGDFIVEYIGQTRGWFYTLHVLATALFDRPAFKTCVVHGVLLGDDGQKLSKRLAQLPGPGRRCSTPSAPTRCAGRCCRRRGAARRRHGRRRRPMEEAVRQVLMPIWNAWYFLSLYANAAGVAARLPTDRAARARPLHPGQGPRAARPTSPRAWTPTTCPARARRSSASSTRSTTGTSAAAATGSGPASRPRSTRCTRCSACCAALAAPLLPLTTDAVYRDLTGDASCTSSDWPSSDERVLDADPDLVDDHGRGPRGVLGRGVDPQGQRHPEPPTPVEAHRRRARRRARYARSRRSSPTRRT